MDAPDSQTKRPPGRPSSQPVAPTAGTTFELTKYPNRRLYSRSLHRYVILEDVGHYWDRGVTIKVTMSKNRSVDITMQVLMEMLLQRVIEGKLVVNEAQLRELGGL